MKRGSLALLAICVTYALLYARTVQYGFVWDDFTSVRDSPVYDRPLLERLRTTEHARMDERLSSVQGIEPGHESYRPLLILSYGLDIALFGRVAQPMHVHCVVLGLLGVLAAYWLALRVLAWQKGALLVAAIFALHPLHVEAIAYVTTRADVLSGTLALVAAALVFEGFALSAGIALLASLFVKEANLGLVVAVAALAWATGRLRLLRRGVVALAGATLAYLVLRVLLVPQASKGTHGGLLLRAIVALPAICLHYLLSFFAPFDLSIARPLAISNAIGWGVWIAIAALVIWGARRAERAEWRDMWRLVGASLLWAIATVGPAAVAVFTLGAVADRYAFVPVFGFAVAVVALGARVAERSRIAERGLAIVSAAFLLLCAVVTSLEIPAWADNAALYTHALAVHPESGLAQYRVGFLYAQNREWDEAAKYFEAAIARDDQNDRFLNNLGVARMNQRRFEEADRAFRRALAVSDAGSFRAWYNLATLARAMGRDAEACPFYDKALALSPQYDRARRERAQVCGEDKGAK